VDGETLTQTTSEQRLIEILNEVGIKLNDGDKIRVNGYFFSPYEIIPDLNKATTIQVYRSKQYSLTENGETRRFHSAEETLGQALWEAGYLLYDADKLSPPPETTLTAGQRATLELSRSITILSADNEFQHRTTSMTVDEALTESGFSLQGLDYSIPSSNESISPDMQIHIIRVQEEVSIEQDPLPFETESQPVSDLEIDNQSIIQPGEYGLTARRIRIRYEDGEEISRSVDDEWVAKEPVPRIIGYGTNIVMRTADTADGPIQYWRALRMWATSYSPSSAGGSTTATGQTVRKGLVAINYHYIPFGTQMYVPGYGFAEAADTGNLSPRSIDLGYTDAEYEAWHQYVTVYFLWPPPENIVWIIP
jgi:uncharacterized protein YabE (DUF348 family)